MDTTTAKKWDYLSMFYDWNTLGAEKRWASLKENFFSQMGDGKILFLAVGTGIDIQHFPPGKNVVGIDISPNMLEKATPRAHKYMGTIELKEMDAGRLAFPDETFDQVFTVCTFCSVPDPVGGLNELRRVLRAGNDLWMFEHTSSRHFPFRQILTIMNPLANLFGPSITQDTVSNVKNAGFDVKQVSNIYLDIVKTIHAVKAE